ncbi:MAG: sigma-70 family RNA polymerase sigma factor [Polyangiaceae bacterium]
MTTVATGNESRDAPEVLSRFHAEAALVDINARQLARRLVRTTITLDDLRSFGHEGLLQAARTFDESRGVPFRRWANLRVRGAMIDGVRQLGTLPRRLYRELGDLAAADRVQEVYDEEDAAAPATTPEAADARLTSHLAGLATAMAMSNLAGRAPGDDEPDAEAPSPADLAELSEQAAHLRAVVSRLPDVERALIERHYFADETLDAAAASLGLSKSWGSRLHARAIDTLARELKKLR